MIAPAHICRWPGCTDRLPDRFDFCRLHWQQLPPAYRHATLAEQMFWIGEHLHNLRQAARRVERAQQGLWDKSDPEPKPPQQSPASVHRAWANEARASRPAPLKPYVKPYPTETDHDE